MADRWVDLETGQVREVPDEELVRNPDRFATPERRVAVTGARGPGTVPAGELPEAARYDYRQETPGEYGERVSERKYGGRPLAAAGLGLLRGATVGLSDQLMREFGVDMDSVNQIRARNQALSVGGELVGAAVPALLSGGESLVGEAAAATPAGMIARAGAGAERLLGGGLAGATGRGALEGALFGAGGEASASALEERPIDVERLAAAMGSGALLGGAGGAVFYGLGKAATTTRKLAEARAAYLTGPTEAGVAIRESVGGLATGLREADEAMESLRGHGLGREVEAVRRTTARLETLLETPEHLAQKPWIAAQTIKAQQTALEGIAKRGAEIRAQVVDAGDPRHLALDSVDRALATHENGQLVHRIFQLKETAAEASQPTLMGHLAEGAASMAGFKLGAPLGAGWAGARAGRALVGRLGTAAAQVGAKVSRAAELLATAGSRGAPAVALPLALRDVSYGPPSPRETPEVPARSKEVREYRQRRDELLGQVEPDPRTGKLKMTREARRRVAVQLAPISEVSPTLADVLESLAARRVAYLAGALPKPKDRVTVGPDSWFPSQLALGGFRRKAGAVEDPAGVLERARMGNVTPEEAEALWEVFPEMMRDAHEQIMTRLDQLRSTMDYKGRVAISILPGAPVDPAMAYNVLEVLQSNYEEEAGGGMEAPPTPKAGEAAFGKVKAPEPTEAQIEAGGSQ